MIIYSTYSQKKTTTRDPDVKEMILRWMSSNMASMADGIVNHVPVLSGTVRDRFARPYGIDATDWNTIKKSPEFRKMEKTATILKLGLLISYLDTKDPIFLDFLMILIYSALMYKYYPQGFNKHIMQYTIDHADARTDFKKYGSLIITLRKKCETFLDLFEKRMAKNRSDVILREALQSITTRLNDMVKNLRRKLQTHMDDPDMKIMMAFSTTQDGKQVINALGTMERIREKAIDNLAFPSDKVLMACGLGTANVRNLPYRGLFTAQLEHHFGELSLVSNQIFDEWMRRNKDDLKIQTFRTGFIKSMKVARNMSTIKKEIDAIIYDMVADHKNPNINKIDARNYLYDYLLKNLFLCGLEIVH